MLKLDFIGKSCIFIKILAMKFIFIILFIFLHPALFYGQDGFQYYSQKDKITIPFKLINNLIFIPLKVNGVNVNFLLDSGVQETILFSLDDDKSIALQNVERIKFAGFGHSEYVEGLKSSGNAVEVGGMLKDLNHEIYIILDEDFNISSSVGIPVNGIIGYHFFKNFPVEINYLKKKIVIYKAGRLKPNKVKKFNKYKLSIENNKPYLLTDFAIDTLTHNAKLLLDTGNSDALWLFQNRIGQMNQEVVIQNDYLGRGFSGEIYGDRVKLKHFKIDCFAFKNSYAAIPDTVSIRNLHLVDKRIGSIGSELLKRFTTVFDYKNQLLYLKKNSYFNNSFTYNNSGLDVHHKGLQWIQERVSLKSSTSNKSESKFNTNSSDYLYKFELKPVFIISSVRKDSPAYNCGLRKDDILIMINGRMAHNLSLQQINDIFRSDKERKIVLEIERNNRRMKFIFYLKGNI